MWMKFQVTVNGVSQMKHTKHKTCQKGNKVLNFGGWKVKWDIFQSDKYMFFKCLLFIEKSNSMCGGQMFVKRLTQYYI